METTNTFRAVVKLPAIDCFIISSPLVNNNYEHRIPDYSNYIKTHTGV
jgi:hypothetical protein